MITYKTTMPSRLNLLLLKQEVKVQWADAIDANITDKYETPKIAVYFPDETVVTQSDVDVFVALHDGTKKTQSELDAETRQQRQAKLRAALDADTLSLADLADVVREILGD